MRAVALRQRHARAGLLARVALLALTAAALVSCGQEDLPQVEVTFRNGTDRPLAWVVGSSREDLADVVERTITFPMTFEPGEEVLNGAPYPPSRPAEGELWCPPELTYYFISPVEPTLRSTGASKDDPPLRMEDFDLVDVLAEPCWPEPTGNLYVIEG